MPVPGKGDNNIEPPLDKIQDKEAKIVQAEATSVLRQAADQIMKQAVKGDEPVSKAESNVAAEQAERSALNPHFNQQKAFSMVESALRNVTNVLFEPDPKSGTSLAERMFRYDSNMAETLVKNLAESGVEANRVAAQFEVELVAGQHSVKQAEEFMRRMRV